MAVNRVAQPFYDDSVNEYHNKNYRQVLFTSGRAVQCRELTGIGSYATEHIKEVAGLMYKDGTILSGCTVSSIDRTARTDCEDAISGATVGLLTLSGGKIFVDGYPFEIEFEKFPKYSKKTVPIKLEGPETIYVEILDTAVSALEDEDLLDPASGYDNYEAPGAHRLQRIARYISTCHKDFNEYSDNIRVPIVKLIDGKVSYEAGATETSSSETGTSMSSETNLMDVISQRTFETSGNYLVKGFKVKADKSPDNTKIGITVTPGIAYIGGQRIELNSSFTGYIDKVMVTSTVQGEEHAVEYESTDDDDGNRVVVKDLNGEPKISRRYKLNSTPVSSVSEVAVPIVGKKRLTYNQGAISYITGLGGSVNSILYCYVPTSTEPGESSPESLPETMHVFRQGIDYKFENQGIVWLNTTASENPMSLPDGVRGTTFYVQFLYKPNLTADKYRIEYSSKREVTLKYKVTNGVVTIPSEFYNPTIKSVKNPYVADGDDYLALEENKQYYQSGNKIYVATKNYPTIPVRVVRRSSTNTDNLGIPGAVVKTAKSYSESGVVYYRLDSSIEANPDYRVNTDTGAIEWLNTKNRPSYGEAYLVEATVPEGVCVDFGDEEETVIVNFTYENLTNVYSNTCHDSYLVLDDSVKISRHKPENEEDYLTSNYGDNITLAYEVAKARTTTVGLDANGKISFYHGTVLDQYNNLTPVVPTSSLVIADLYIKPTTSETFGISSYENYRLRMTDLRNMFNRLKDVEYNISLNELEQEAETKLAGSVLRGVFTDSFTTVNKMDNSLVRSFISNTDNQAIPLVSEGFLSPNYKKCQIDLTVNEDNTTAGLFGNLYMLTKKYTEEVWMDQPFATTYRSAAEGLDLMQCFPSFTIDPDNDQFIEYEDDELLYDNDTFGKKACYVFNGDAASLISDGSIAFPTEKNKVVTLQFWMYLDTAGTCMPVAFNGVNKVGVDVISNKNYFGFNTWNSDVNGIKNEQLMQYWRAYTFIFKCKGDKNTDTSIYINGDKQYNVTYSTSSSGKYNPANLVFGNKIRLSGSFNAATGYNFKGKIADVRLWNKALSADEIKKSLSEELEGNESGLIGWWKDPIKDGRVVDSCLNGTKHDLVVTANGGFAANKAGKVTSELRSFAKMLKGEDLSAATGAVLKNIVDYTTGSVPDNSVEIILDPTKSSISAAGKYVTQDQNFDSNSTGQNGQVKYVYDNASGQYVWSSGERIDTANSFNNYEIVETYYERVVKQTDEIIGNFVSDISSVSTLRQRIITVKGSGFLENTDLISLTFDGIPVDLYKLNDYNAATDGEPSSFGKEKDRYWKTTSDGKFRCGFIIPANIPIGVREVVLKAPGDITLKASYWGAGMKASKLTLTQTNETVTWEPRTMVIGSQYMNEDGWILLDGWDCRRRCGTTPLCQTFYVNDSSLSRPVISDIGVNSDVFLTSADVYFRTAGDCPDCIAGFVELTDSGFPRSDSGAGPSRFVGGVQVFPTTSIGTGADSAEIETIDETPGTVQGIAGNMSRGTAATRIRWTDLVPLKGGKGYGFIVGSTDGNTTMWIASIENKDKNVDVSTGQSIISEPDRGILLSSPNGQTWAVYHYEDLKYTFRIANFFADNSLESAPETMRPSQAFGKIGKVSYVEYNPVNVEELSNDSLSKMNFFIYEVNSQNSNDGSGFIVYQYSYLNESSGKWSSWMPFEVGSVVKLENAAKFVKIRAALYSYNPYSTPILDKNAKLTTGQFVLPAVYTSITGAVGNWNKAEVYIDKFFDENFSNVELYISPDQGYTWRKMDHPVDVNPIIASASRYNGEPVNQYHYKLNLEIEAPIIEDITINTNGNPGDFEHASGDWEFAVALVDAFGNESPLSNKVIKNITNNNTNLEFKVIFDPNATGFRIYARLLSQPDLYLFYDSTASATLLEDLQDTEITSEIRIGKGGAAFPTSGVVLIDNEYIKYNEIRHEPNNDIEGGREYILSGTEFARNATHMGRESVLGAHTAGTEVLLVNEGFLHQDSPTPCVSGLWRFPEYTVDSDNVWRFMYTAKNALYPLRDSDLNDVKPHYDEDLPANFTSETVTFRVELSAKGTDEHGDPITRVDSYDKVCGAGRVMITCGYEAY